MADWMLGCRVGESARLGRLLSKDLGLTLYVSASEELL